MLGLLLAHSFAAYGGTTGNPWETDETLESVVVTATRIEQSLLDASEAVSVVDADDILRRSPELLAEMLRGVPGAWFQQTTPGQGIPIIRGLKGSQVLHLVDGMRLNNAFFRDAPNQYLGLVDAYATERAEVVRGAAPSLYGADAMGGVVQVLTAEPTIAADGPVARGRFYGGYNSFDSSLIGRVEGVAGRTGSVLSGGVTWQDHGDRRTGGGEVVRPSGYTVEAADVKWRRDFGNPGELTLSAQYLDQPDTPRVDELLPGYGQDQPASAEFRFQPNRREFLHARYRLQVDSSLFDRFEAHLARQVITDDRYNQDFGSTVISQEHNESKLDGLTLQFNTPWGSTASAELVWGLEYYADTVSSSRMRSQTGSEGSIAVTPRFPDGSTMDSLAAYAYNHWVGERWSIDAGLRYSEFDTFLPGSGDIPEAHLQPTDWTGDIHFGYELGPGTHVVSNIGRGFRPPNVFDLGTLGPRPGNRYNLPNPNLKPETVWSCDLGLKHAGARWQIEAFAWYSDYRDKIGSRLTGDTTPSGRLVVQSGNLNEARLYGFESGLRFRVDDRWSLYAVLNYSYGEESVAGGAVSPADRMPPLNGRFGAVWEPRAGLRFEPYLDFAGPQDRLSPRDEEDPRIDPLGTAGWGTLNLLATWHYSARTEFGLKLQNLGDKDYREHGSGIDAPGRNLGLWINFLAP